MDIRRIQPRNWNSRAVVHGNTAYFSGIVADDKSGTMAEQTADILNKIDALLADVGSNKSRVLSAVVYLAEMDRKEEMNESWIAWMDPDNPPARAAVGSELTPGTLVEIMITAAV